MKLNKNNKERVYEFITTYSLEFEHDEYPRFTTNFLSGKLGMQRTNLSSILNQLVNEGKLIKQKGARSCINTLTYLKKQKRFLRD